MQPTTRFLSLPALLLGWLGLVGTVAAVFPPAIKDDGKMFTSEGLEKANKKIKEIYQNYKKDVVIETFAAIPSDLEKKFKDKKKEDFFREWAESRTKDLGVNGIYVLICKEPRYLYIDIDRESRKKAFTRKDYEKMREKIFAGFRDMKFDAGLWDGLEAVESALKANVGK
jgi:hypothetical protein